MKTKILRIGKRSVSVILTLIMIFTMTLVGTISSNAAITKWRVIGQLTSTSWTVNDNYTISGSAGSVTIDLSSRKGQTIVFKLQASENNAWIYNGCSGTVTAGSENQLYWNGGNDIKYTISSTGSGKVKFTVSQKDLDNNGSLENILVVTEEPVSTTKTPELYLFGDYGDGENWDTPATSTRKFTSTSSGYTLTFDMIGASGSNIGYFRVYDKANNKQYGPSGTEDVMLTDANNSYALNENKVLNFGYNVGTLGKTVTITVDKNLSKITIKADQTTSDGDCYYVVGRFMVKDASGNPVYTADNDYVWDAGSTNIPFTKTSTAGLYKLDTNCTIAELSALIADGVPYFRIGKGTETAVETVYEATADTGILESNASVTTYVLATGKGKSLYFDAADSTNEKLVTLWYNANTSTFYYTFVNVSEDDTTKMAYVKSHTARLWVDAAPQLTEETSTLIKWNNYRGSHHSTRTSQVFYLPANINLSAVTVYNGYSSDVVINGYTIHGEDTAVINLPVGTYTTSGACTETVEVKQGSTNAMFLYTTNKDGTEEYDLPTSIGAGASKSAVNAKGGSCVTVTSDGTFSDVLAIENVKGRGNSSWEASNKIFGKYAYNMKLLKKTSLLGMDSAKSWCLLANNADEAMLRNALTYSLADEIGLYNSPEYRFVDIYDNSEYLGSYMVSEKVDVGNSKLVKGESIDDINEDEVKDLGAEEIDESTKTDTYSYGGNTYKMQYTVVSDNPDFDPDYKKGTYLLEFEIASRYTAEASWFQSPQGQYVVVKSPEYATKEQVKYIAEKFAAMEAAVYASSTASLESIAAHIDLDSFARMYLIQELSSNLDSAATSYFITFNCADGEDARFVASPVWDYDWAYGQYWKLIKKDKDGNLIDPNNPKAWYAKKKQMGDNQANKYSLQSRLATNTNFETVIKKVWNGTSTQDGFYDIIQTYYSSNGQINDWYNEISPSVDMNEYRWEFIEKNLLGTEGNNDSWGSSNTGDTHAEAVEFLRNWCETRSVWMNTEINKYNDYSQFTPVLNTYETDGTTKTEITAETTVKPGNSVILKVDAPEAFVTYKFYEVSGTTLTPVGTSSDGTGTVTVIPSSGTHTYRVVASYNSTDKNSTDTNVTVGDVAFTTTFSVDNTTVALGKTLTLTATASPTGSYTYEFYRADDSNGTNETLLSSGNSTYTYTPTAGEYYYYAKISNGTVTLTTEKVLVTITEVKITATISSDKTNVVTGETFTLTVNATPANPSYRYEFFKFNTETQSGESLGVASVYNTKTITADAEGTYTYYAKVYNGKTATTSNIEIIVSAPQDKHDVTIYFKSPSAAAYTPSIKLDDGEYQVMTQGLYLGPTFSGSLKVYWYSVTFTDLDSSVDHTITIKSNRTKLNSSMTGRFNNDTYYLAVNDVMNGGDIIDLSDKEEYIRNYYFTANNLVYANAGTNGHNLGYTYVKDANGNYGIRRIGVVIDELTGEETFSVDSVTLAQFVVSKTSTVSDLQYDLLDVNLDGVVDVNDATCIQFALAS